MTREEVFEKLNMVFRDVFDDESLTVVDKTTANDVEDWDSLMQITLITELERSFGVRFDMADVVRMKNVGDMVDKIVELIS